MSDRHDEPSAPADGPAPIAAIVARAGYMMGETFERTWARDDAVAWEGLLETARTLRRGAEAALEQRHDLGISMLGIMGRLARAPRRTLRQTDLADAMGLSLSRISRIIDILESRALVQREPCPSDARATNVRLTRGGSRRTAAAQETIHDYVDEHFVRQLNEAERTTLAAVFTRLLDHPSAAADRHAQEGDG